MPIIRKREIKQLLPEERDKKLAEMRTELTKLRTSVKSGGNVDNVGRIRELKRTIARVLTSMHENVSTETARQ